MAIDWEFVNSLTDAQLQGSDQDDQFHKEICDILLADVDEADLTDHARVKHLLHVAGVVIKQKTEDLQEVESYGTELVNNAESKIVKLESELQAKESIISDLQYGGTGRDARYLRDELRTLEAENERLKKEVKDLGTEAGSSRDNIEKITNDYMECKALNRRLESDNDQLKKDILDLKNQMEAQREALMIKRDGDEGRLMKRLQSQEQTRFMSEIHELTEANEFLKDEVEEITQKLKSATAELVKLTDEYASMKTVITETDKANERLEEENAGLKLQVQDLQALLVEQGSFDNNVMTHVNTEVEKWKKLLTETEEKLVDERKRNHILAQQLDATKLDADKKVMAELAQAVSDKDKQIEELKKELDEGYKQLQLMGEFAEELQASEAVQETNHLEKLLNDYKNSAKAERERLRKLEADSAERDKQLAEALTKIGQYENGTYGLREAVQEIKDLKRQLGIRDGEITETTKQMNKLEMNLCQALDENEEMRRRLGLDPSENIDLSELKFTKAAEQEQLRAVNRLLTTEVERLERDRIEMKKVFRKQAMHRGVRAVELGLKTEDLEAIEEAAAEAGLSANESTIIQDQMIAKFQELKSEERNTAVELKREVKELKIQNNNLSKSVDDLTQKNAEITAKFSKVEKEKERFEAALKEALKNKAGGKLEDQPEIYRLLALMEDRLNQSYPDLTQHLKAQVAQLSGRNLELRAELARTKEEMRRCERERASAAADLARFAPSSAQVFPSAMIQGSQPLAHQLIIALQEMEEKEKLCKEMERQLLHTQDQLSRLTAQQGLLYEEHYKLKTDLKTKSSAQQINNSDSDLQAHKEELERLQKVLQQSGNDQKKSISEASRKMVLLKVHERTMRRELKSLYEREEANEREIKRLKILDDYRVKETRERLVWLEQFKDSASYHIQQLRDQLINCVPQKDVEKLFESYTNITNKYRKLLEEESLIQQSTQKVHELQDELRRTQAELEDSQKKLAVQTQRCERFEERLAAINEPTRDGETANFEDKIYNLEMQLINEKQKASHAINKHSKLLSVTHELEERNTSLEDKFTELVDRNTALQQREKSLTEDLEAVTKHGGKDSRTQILEKQVVALQAEVKRVQTAADISADQTRTLLARKDQKQKEIEQYKVTLGELEKQTNDKLTIGLLTQRLIEVQNRDIESNKLVEEFKLKLSQEQSKMLVLETKLADQLKLQDLQHKKVVSHVQLLSRTICYLRGQYSGAVPLQRQQRLGEAFRALVVEKQDLSSRLAQAEKEKGELEVELEHLKSVGNKSLPSVSKVRLSEMRLKREVTQLKQQLTYLEKLVKDHEETIRELEDENSGVYELLTEQRALDTSISTVQQSVVSVSAAVKQEQPSRGVDKYVLCSKCKEKLGAKEETRPSKLVSLEIDYLTKQVAKKDEKIKTQKEEINLLKNSLSSSHTKIVQLNKDIDKLEEQLAVKNGSNPEDYSAFKKSQASAQQAISVLNDRIEQKDVAIKKYQEMLKDLRTEAKLAREKHERELQKLSKEHSMKEQEWLSKYQHLSTELQSLQDVGVAPSPHKRAELEELILEQDKANALLRDSIFKLRQEISDLKTERAANQQTSEKEKEKLKVDMERKLKKQNNEIAELNKQNASLLGENNDLADENKNLKKAKSPRGKSESSKLVEKEAEIAKLKEALILLRQEMTSLIEERLRENAAPVEANEANSEKRARETENLRSKVAKLQKERDEIAKEKTVLAAQLATKLNPKQTSEIETLKKQLTIQREKFNKLKSSHDSKPPALLPPRDTQARVRELEKELETAKKDSTTSKPPSTVIDAWLDNKKWTKKIENQKKALEKKEKEIETITKQNSGMRETIERLDREKLLLNTKLKNALKLNSKANNKDPKGYTDTQIYTQELKRRIFELEEENATLKHDLTRDITNPLAERDSTISVLKHTISGLERQLQECVGEDAEAINKLAQIQELRIEQEKKTIELEHELLSAKLQAEHANLELPRLRTRVNELQAYTDVLKPASTGRTAPPPLAAGKSVVELERVINAMKRVIEKLQKENAQMKSQLDSATKHKENKPPPVQQVQSEKAANLEKTLKQTQDKLKAVQEELDCCADEKVVLQNEVRKLRDSLRELNEQIEGQEEMMEKKNSENMLILEHRLTEEQAVVTQLRENLTRVEEDNRRENTLLSEIRRRLTGVAEREADLEEEIKLLHECQMPNGAKEIAKEAVRLKRQNEKLTDQLQNLTKSTAPGLDPVFLEKLEELKSDNEVMVRKIVLYQKQLTDLAIKYPEEEIVVDFQGTASQSVG